MTSVRRKTPPAACGLYDPQHERDSCGVGFVAHVKGEVSHQIIRDAEHLLCRMDHRGARGAEPNTGDGAGMLTGLPHEFLARVAREDLGTELPEPGRFGAGVVFLPNDPAERESLIKEAEDILAKGCVGHNPFWFYQFALQAALNNREWDYLQRFREGAEKYDPELKSAWTRFYIERSSVLETWYRDRYSDDTEARRLALLETCSAHRMVKSARELKAIGGDG